MFTPTQADLQLNHPIETSFEEWYTQFRHDWHQGEHVALIGQTGTGKTTVAHAILRVRDYVCVLAIKRKDDTLNTFKEDYAIIKQWPPSYRQHKVVLWVKPKSLDRADVVKQANAVHTALNKMYISGGWCIYFDEAGYIAGVLGLSAAMGILLNQGRSAHLSVVCTMTRPSSVVARIPREALTQIRHHLIFKYTDENEMKKCADVVGISLARMRELQKLLHTNAQKGFSDFLYVGKGREIIVRNT